MLLTLFLICMLKSQFWAQGDTYKLYFYEDMIQTILQTPKLLDNG